MGSIKLSILTPAVWSRADMAKRLAERVATQATDEVEHLVLYDDRKRTIGAKRQALQAVARGEYITFVDDDDGISDDYVVTLLDAIQTKADVIVFNQQATVNGAVSLVRFSLKNQDEPFKPEGVTLRSGWHSCVWNRELVRDCVFGESNYGEDLVWCLQARRLCRNEARVDKVLHFYNHDEKTTEAPAPV
jgi:glycosyltransferase involved in cell wall biosynthesis